MRPWKFIAMTALVCALGGGIFSTSGSAAPARQWSVVYLHQPTRIGSTIVQGPVLFTHDEAKMARGEPCTTVQLLEPSTGPTESIASFHCIPTRRPVVNTFTITTRPNVEDGFGCVLTEYQFAGDAEGHGVPVSATGH
jgi:hypothetical protein